jgi:hypothetical protein
MIRTLSTALVASALLTRAAAAWTMDDACVPIPAECIPIECCEPWKPAAGSSESLPQPPARPPAPPVDVAPPAAVNADAISPQPLNRPTIEPPVADPALPEPPARAVPSAQPAVDATPASEQPAGYASPAELSSAADPYPAEAPAPAAEAPPGASRYSTPPTPAPAPADAADIEDVFEAPAAAAESEPRDTSATSTEQPAAQTEPAAPTTGGADASEEAPANPPAAAPEGVPGEEDLFGPSSAVDPLRAPGGWESASARTWSRVDGRPLASGQIAAATGKAVVVTTDDGRSLELRYAELSAADLGFLRMQIEARREQLARRHRDERLLAEQR